MTPPEPDALADAIRAVYADVRAPDWARPNLDALVDVLRDLSWLPDGEVVVPMPDTAGLDDDAAGLLVLVLLHVETETADGPRPVRVSG